MKVLHILRSEPDVMTTTLIKKTFDESQPIMVSLFEVEVDYTQLVRNIFEADKVISWW